MASRRTPAGRCHPSLRTTSPPLYQPSAQRNVEGWRLLRFARNDDGCFAATVTGRRNADNGKNSRLTAPLAPRATSRSAASSTAGPAPRPNRGRLSSNLEQWHSDHHIAESECIVPALNEDQRGKVLQARKFLPSGQGTR